MTTSDQLAISADNEQSLSIAAASGAHRDRLLDAVEEVAAELEAEAQACEALGKLTDRALELLRGTGVGWGWVPEELGGFGMLPSDVYPVLERIARIDGSIGWIATIVASSGPLLANLDQDTAKVLLADGLPMFAASGAPTGRAVAVDGGFRFSGSYQYSSGGLHADYVFCMGLLFDGDAPVPVPPSLYLIPSSAVTHGGNWDTLGLRGTGSVDFTVEDYFVPAEHVVNPLAEPNSATPAALGGNFLLIHLMHIGWASGMVRRMLDEVVEHAQRPSSRPGAPTKAENPAFRREYAEHETAAKAARALVVSVLADIDATLLRGESPSRRQITELFGASQNLHETARQTALWGFTVCGGASLRAGVIQRVFRDTLSGCQHLIADPNHLSTIGHELLAAPPESFWIGPILAGAE